MNDKEILDLIAKEGERKEFTYKNYDCLIRRTPMKILCGYVKLLKEHKYFGKDYDNIPVEVHGGITWSGEFQDEEGYYLGFDCGHFNDLIPYEIGRYPSFISDMPSNDVYRTMEYVEQEIKSMIDQMEEETKWMN